MSRLLARLARPALLIVMLLGSALITATSVGYFDFETLPPFVIEKLPVRFEALWLASLRIHVASASLAFPLCLMSMTRVLQRRPLWHRLIGRVAGIIVLLALVPSGIVLSFDAKGGAAVTAGFLLSAAIVAGGMVWGVTSARRRELASHRRAMHHVVAQMSVAVSSRLLIVGLDALGVAPELAYLLSLWVPVLSSALVAELVSRRSSASARRLVPSVERIPRDISPPSLVVRLRAVRYPVPRLGR